MFILKNHAVEKLPETTSNLCDFSSSIKKITLTKDQIENLNKNPSFQKYIKDGQTLFLSENLDNNSSFQKYINDIDTLFLLANDLFKKFNKSFDISYDDGIVNINIPNFLLKRGQYNSAKYISGILSNDDFFSNEITKSLVVADYPLMKKRMIFIFYDVLFSLLDLNCNSFPSLILLLCQNNGISNEIIEKLHQNDHLCYLNLSSINGTVGFFNKKDDSFVWNFVSVKKFYEQSHILNSLLLNKEDEILFSNLVVLFSALTSPNFYKNFPDLIFKYIECSEGNISLLLKYICYHKEFGIITNFEEKFEQMGINMNKMISSLLDDKNTASLEEYYIDLEIDKDKFCDNLKTIKGKLEKENELSTFYKTKNSVIQEQIREKINKI